MSNAPSQPASKPRVCPHCGAEVSERAEQCWLCHTRLTAGEGSAAPATAWPAPSPGSENALLIAVGVAALVVTLGTALSEPGVLIVVLLLATPVLVRTARLQREPGRNWWLDLFSSLGVIVSIGLAASISFFLTCFAICMGMMGVAESGGGKMNYEVWIYGGLFAAICVSIFVTIKVAPRLWRKKA